MTPPFLNIIVGQCDVLQRVSSLWDLQSRDYLTWRTYRRSRVFHPRTQSRQPGNTWDERVFSRKEASMGCIFLTQWRSQKALPCKSSPRFQIESQPCIATLGPFLTQKILDPNLPNLPRQPNSPANVTEPLTWQVNHISWSHWRVRSKFLCDWISFVTHRAAFWRSSALSHLTGTSHLGHECNANGRSSATQHWPFPI